MQSLEDVLNGNPDETTKEAPQAPEPAPAEDPPKGEPEAPPAPPEGAPPAPEDDEDKPLPAHVVKAIRGERNDWKERAIRAEAEAKAMREMQQRPQMPSPPQEPREMSPAEIFEARLFVERSNMSQVMARQAYPDLDEKVGKFVEMAQANPALIAEMRAHPHPYEFAYQHAVKHALLQEIGTDPAAYRKRIEDEIRAELAASQSPTPAAPAAPRAPLPPTSLATARSAAPRSATTWTGPTPLEDIVKRG